MSSASLFRHPGGAAADNAAALKRCSMVNAAL